MLVDQYFILKNELIIVSAYIFYLNIAKTIPIPHKSYQPTKLNRDLEHYKSTVFIVLPLLRSMLHFTMFEAIVQRNKSKITDFN